LLLFRCKFNREEIVMKGIEGAIEFALHAHAGQVDKGGAPYITHPLRVMAAVDGDDHVKIAAVLHDVVEDTKSTVGDIEEKFGLRVAELVLLLTRVKGESDDDYYAGILSDPEAIAIKLADLADNMDVTRLKVVGPADAERLEKYIARHALLSGRK
jgi:GTP diphosphokinase / guanosine-3',5'-bis(diphosphate) 3'-diphosphatase